METKNVIYAYTTSIHADQYNHGKGAWLVQHFFDGMRTSTRVFQDNEKDKAFDYADALPGSYNRFSMKRKA